MRRRRELFLTRREKQCRFPFVSIIIKSSSFFGLIVPAHNDDDDGKMTPFVSSTCFCCPRVPAEASSAREPAARRKIESFQRTSNDDDASPCRYLTTENCKSAKARAAFARKRTLLRFYVQFFVQFCRTTKEKRKESSSPSHLLLLLVCARRKRT